MEITTGINTGIYKIYDTEEEKWITDECALFPDGNLYRVIQKNFDKVKLELIHTKLLSEVKENLRYIVYRNIYLTDKNGDLIFEGDILRSKKGVMGVVSYITEQAAYVLLQPKLYKYYNLGEDICKELKKIGHITKNSELVYNA